MTGLKLKSVTIFPSRVSGGLAMDVEKTSGNYTIAIDYNNLAVVSPYIPKATDYALVWDSAADNYFLAPTTTLATAGVYLLGADGAPLLGADGLPLLGRT